MSSETIAPIPIGWKCNTCGQLITRTKDGWVEWRAFEDRRGTTHVTGVRLVHRLPNRRGKRGPQSCRYDARRYFRRDRSIVEGLSLESFLGPDGLMLLLSFVAAGEMPVRDIIELAKRVQIPGYELIRHLPRQVTHKFTAPSIGDGFYLQSEIRAVLASYDQRQAG